MEHLVSIRSLKKLDVTYVDGTTEGMQKLTLLSQLTRLLYGGNALSPALETLFKEVNNG
ncbi:MAG: hypothetical protein V6Z78_01605 [Holosporaceae bacterium]